MELTHDEAFRILAEAPREEGSPLPANYLEAASRIAIFSVYCLVYADRLAGGRGIDGSKHLAELASRNVVPTYRKYM